jgi:putative Ca2+/H+ antiporter (TMEM165/GDT1 family)
VPPVVMEVFVLTFLAEWGDRSQLATIGLAASTNVVGARSSLGLVARWRE